ncbi:siderophore-interacting protein [Dermatophilus congolensis]|uniref:NADPH-dependent ferric-chelate reductase n=1 Tax=Dermatophilus congolensis TaxID=1863 RepID=A0A239VBU8_9MICO|nr:siderophore-interacting protein [Dermatophilus congolensis]MBO3128531.1 siderophore-interacting protein [Dermatophilus congolensis]MBO3132833.1 siderophore-interacting protein [Dermatophilus congolensis]MBO3133008.1 siderophore-interacting protein [Dermatophilus congolensis]MBO3135244.1 siderophore-interacting protein [Dermatophilus congolensis]MBO3137482.1 siderophore-interacting protein [Dermatophilus congolensis]
MTERVRRAREGLGVCVVTAVEDVTPRMRRVTFSGSGLAEAVATGPDQRVKLSFPDSHRFTGDADEMSRARRKRRTYTLLWLDAQAGEATVDFVLHPGGVAAAWASQVQVGDELMLTAPVGGFVPVEGAEEVVLVADETGLPALQAIVASLTAELPVRAFVEVADAAEHQPVRSVTGAEVDVVWMDRGGAAHGSRMSELAASLPGEVSARSSVWIAGESAAVRQLRNALVTQGGLDRHQVDAVAYWTKAEGRNAGRPGQ